MTDPKKPITEDTDVELLLPDGDAIREVVRQKLLDAQTPGYQAEFSPEEAEFAGAFVEDALSEDDAIDSSADLLDALGEERPGFLDEEGPSAEIPTFITRTNARERFGMKPDETVPDAIARHNAKEG